MPRLIPSPKVALQSPRLGSDLIRVTTMDFDKKAASIDDRKSVVEGQVEQDAVNKIKPESLAHLSDDEIALRSQKLTRKVDLFSEHPFFPPS